MGHEQLKVYEDKPPIYEIYEKNYYINNHTCNIIIYKNKKRRKYLHDLIKYGNYTNMG